MKKLMIQIERHYFETAGALAEMAYDAAKQLNEGDDVEFWFAPDTAGLRTGAIEIMERELRPNCRKLIYRDPNGKRLLLGLNGRPKCKKLKAVA